MKAGDAIALLAPPVMLLIAALSQPAPGAPPPAPAAQPQLQAVEADRYVAEHPSRYSVWEVHAAVVRLKARREAGR